jgi:phospholipid/cholesterol/gamma-HCH transport system substrate-binding protein
MLERLNQTQLALIGLASILLFVGMARVGIAASFGEYDPGYELTARFEEAGQNLDTESPVKIRGVDVGRVESIVLDDGAALVTMHLNPGTQVPQSAVAEVRPISVFGPKFIDLVPGDGESDGPFYGDGDEIAETASPLELTDVLDETAQLLEAIEPEHFTTILRTFANGIDGLGGPMGESITDGQEVMDSMIASSADREELLRGAALLSEALADHGDDIVQTGRNFHEFGPTVVAHENDLAGLLAATSRLSSDLASVMSDNVDVMGPSLEAGTELADTTANDLRGLVGYIEFVLNYSTVLNNITRVPSAEGYIMMAQQFLMSSDPCETLVLVPECDADPIDPGPDAAAPGPPGAPGQG